MGHFIGRTFNDIPVYVDLITSEAAKHIAQQPNLLTLATEVLRQTELVGIDINTERDMGRTIGYDYVVGTTDDDVVFYAQLTRENIYTRFVKNGNPLATRHLTLAVSYSQSDKQYNLNDVWIGRLRPPRPGSAQATKKGNLYWEKHAFIFENQSLQSRTLTKTCPY